jgi:hypothetical protein
VVFQVDRFLTAYARGQAPWTSRAQFSDGASTSVDEAETSSGSV